MNMHHITKSLFVGAAIAGIGMSSGRAELKVPKSLKDQIWHVVERRLEECYRQVQAAVPSAFTDGVWEKKVDTNLVYDLIVSQRWGFFHFCSLEMLRNPRSFSTLKQVLRDFFKEQCPPGSQKVQFSNKRIERSALGLNRRIRSIIGVGDKYGLYDDYRGKQSLAQKGIVDKNEYGFRFKHSFVFNDEFIETIARIIHNGMTVVNKMCEITQGGSFNHELLKTYLMAVQRLYVQYLAIKNSPRDNITIGICDKFIEEAECLRKYDCRISPFCDELHPANFLVSDLNEKKKINAIWQNALSELRNWEWDVRSIRDEIDFTDPVYWAPAPVSDGEGADILEELEENDPEKKEEHPNAFLEEID